MKTRLKFSHLTTAFIAMGFSFMISQIVLMRELVLFFTGNELTLGIILAFWLLWTAIGSGVIGKLIKYSSHPIRLLITSQFLLVILLPLSVVFIRSASSIFSIPVGEMTSPVFIVIVPMLALAPVCIIVGMLYALGCRLLSQISSLGDSSAPGRVFFFEAMGSGVAGFIASVILFRYFENFQIVTFVCLLNLFIAFLFWIIIKFRRFIALISFAILSVVILFIANYQLDRFSTKMRWGYLNLVYSETSIYGNIAVTKLEETYSFYENGMLMYTHPDLMYAEESVHFALLEHPKPEKVLLIGGNAAGSLQQVLYHPDIRQVDLVLIDPKSIEIARKILPNLTEILKDDRIRIVYQDGRLFLKQTTNKYDVIIVNLPDPQTALINRFYTLEFYKSAQRKLLDNGILSFSMTSSENVLSEEEIIFLNCLYRTMQRVFPEIVLIPGNAIHFIGCLSPGVLTNDPDLLIKRLQQRKLPTVYVREYYIPFRMKSERMNYVTERITQRQTSIINRDFYPIGYFYSIILWLTYFHSNLKSVVHFINQIDFSLVLIVLASVILILLSWLAIKRRGMRRLNSSIKLTIMVTGFSAISLEVLIILGFQAIYGYVYYQLALIMSGYMIGLMIGSWQSLHLIDANRLNFNAFILFQSILTIYPIITAGMLLALSKIILPSIIVQVIFLCLITGAGFIGGFQFPLANHLVFNSEERIESIGGRLYAADLFGSVIGALLTSAILIPILGFTSTCVIFCIVNLAVLMVLLLMKFSI